MGFTLFGCWVWGRGGGVPKGAVHNLLMQFFTLGSSKIEGRDIRDVGFFLIVVAV